jgi:hypothetical protein
LIDEPVFVIFFRARTKFILKVEMDVGRSIILVFSNAVCGRYIDVSTDEP